MPRKKAEEPSKVIHLTLPAWLWKIVETELKDRIGESDSEKIKTIIVGFLTGQGYFLNNSWGWNK